MNFSKIKSSFLEWLPMVIFFAFIGSLILWPLFDNLFNNREENEDIPQEKIEQEWKIKNQKTIEDLSIKYNVNKEWGKYVRFTSQTQKSIENNATILLQGSIDDVFLKNGKHTISISSGLFDEISYEAELECGTNFLNGIENSKKYQQYVVVVKISETSKSVITETIDGETFEIDNLILKGVCLQVVPLEQNPILEKPLYE